MEEWYFFFEYMYGRTIVSWRAAADKYGPKTDYLLNAFRLKLNILRRSRDRWPTFVSYEEDKALRKPKWDHKYREGAAGKIRLIMWDMTGIDA